MSAGEPARSERQVVRRMVPARTAAVGERPRAAGGVSGSTLPAPKDATGRAQPITARQVEAELNRLEAELAE